MTWILTSEEQPNQSEQVLGYHPNSTTYALVYYYGPEVEEPKTYEDYGWSDGLYISHWAHLPKEP